MFFPQEAITPRTARQFCTDFPSGFWATPGLGSLQTQVIHIQLLDWKTESLCSSSVTSLPTEGHRCLEGWTAWSCRLCLGLAGWSLLSCIFWRLPYQSLEEDSNLSHHSLEKMLGLPGSFWPLFWAPRPLRLPNSWPCSRKEVTSLTDNSRS